MIRGQRLLRRPGRAANACDRQPSQPQRHPPPEHPLAPLVDRPAAEIAWQQRIAAAQAVECCRRMTRALAGDIEARVATADDQHAATGEYVGRFILRRVEQPAVELARIVGPARIPIVPVGNYDAPILSLLSTDERHQPAASGLVTPCFPRRLDRLHAGVELDVVIKLKVIRVAPQIPPDHFLIRVIGIVRRHREVGVLGERLRRDQPRRAVDAAGRCAVVPIATDVILAFETVERDAGRAEALGDREARRARAEDAELLRGGSSRLRMIGSIDGSCAAASSHDSVRRAVGCSLSDRRCGVARLSKRGAAFSATLKNAETANFRRPFAKNLRQNSPILRCDAAP